MDYLLQTNVYHGPKPSRNSVMAAIKARENIYINDDGSHSLADVLKAVSTICRLEDFNDPIARWKLMFFNTKIHSDESRSMRRFQAQ